MNDMELFLNFGAVVEIQRFSRDDLYKFIKLMLDIGHLKEYIVYFINVFKITGEEKVNNNMSIDDIMLILDEEYTDDYFWHIVDINEGTQNRICLEYQYGKGFTFGKKKEYTDYDETIKVLTIDELIKGANKEDIFNMNYEETCFADELEKEKQDLIDKLDNFCDFYDWRLIKYKSGLYNILDIQLNEIKEDENITLEQAIKRVFDRMTDYFITEEDLDGLLEDDELSYVENIILDYANLGKKYNLIDLETEQWYMRKLEEVRQDYAEIQKERAE